jgi:regulator of cell morphogenesis and NO signaling
MIATHHTLGEVVTATPDAAKVFYRYGLDFCCGGKEPLASACASKGLDADTIIDEIEQASATEDTTVRWDQRPFNEIIQHILDRYHTPLRMELPRLIYLAGKVEDAHAGKPECPQGLRDLLEEIQTAVESHLAKEEQILFPLILAGRGRNAHMPVNVMIQEHEDHGQNLQRIRTITRNLELPESACATWRELYRSLGQLEIELMDHIHLENNILFPRALAE